HLWGTPGRPEGRSVPDLPGRKLRALQTILFSFDEYPGNTLLARGRHRGVGRLYGRGAPSGLAMAPPSLSSSPLRSWQGENVTHLPAGLRLRTKGPRSSGTPKRCYVRLKRLDALPFNANTFEAGGAGQRDRRIRTRRR